MIMTYIVDVWGGEGHMCHLARIDVVTYEEVIKIAAEELKAGNFVSISNNGVDKSELIRFDVRNIQLEIDM